jgi:hypothetical protein
MSDNTWDPGTKKMGLGRGDEGGEYEHCLTLTIYDEYFIVRHGSFYPLPSDYPFAASTPILA